MAKEIEDKQSSIISFWITFHVFIQEARREEMLVNRLMRQSQQERRIAVQLMQARHEKEIIRRNRILREKQYEERRMKDFEDSLNKEAVSKKVLSYFKKKCFYHFIISKISSYSYQHTAVSTILSYFKKIFF